ncbi:hypothetical protein GMC37_13140, partial [Turicibacter sanguinis]|nr:hypothetical protein [Turicibacter sanguinis]
MLTNIETLIRGISPDKILINHILSWEADFYLNENGRAFRRITQKERANSKEYLDFDFEKERLIPLFDLSDNNYIVYQTNKNSYGIFNLIDEVIT